MNGLLSWADFQGIRFTNAEGKINSAQILWHMLWNRGFIYAVGVIVRQRVSQMKLEKQEPSSWVVRAFMYFSMLTSIVDFFYKS